MESESEWLLKVEELAQQHLAASVPDVTLELAQRRINFLKPINFVVGVFSNGAFKYET
jgi:hypothetical protein